VTVGPRGLAVDAVPGTEWTLQVRSSCLQGEATALAAEAGGPLVVELEPVLDARLTVEVSSTSGETLAGATVKWVSETPDCVPATPATTDSAGRLVQDLSSGTHTLVVSSPGYAVHEEAITMLPGDDRRVQVQLAAAKVVLEKRRIRILEKVQFEFGQAVLRAESHDLLDQVAAVIVTNPDLGRVEVAGHTDNKGTEAFNLQLSTDRAEAVRRYLLSAGVAENRLLSVGYGESRPIDTNRTERGRETNRRVEFNLVDAPADEGT
jgi:outer membrane protein OmpA-like peptidoglycan-associated protein